MNRKELIIGAVVAVVLIALGIVWAATRPPVVKKEVVTGTSGGGGTYIPGQDKSATEMAQERRDEKTRENARAIIAEYEQTMAENWNSPETPDLLMAMGNIHQYQLDEYDPAIQKYATIIDNFPTHSQAPKAYLEMAKCYELKGDQVQASYVYREMIEKLDPALEQHIAYAKQKLGEM